MFSATTTKIPSYQWLFFILIIYLFNGYNSELTTTDNGLAASSSPTGNCDNSNDDSGCHCPSGWTGRNCTQDIDECTIQPKICNNGICINVKGSYNCYCDPGKTGTHCDLDVNPCWSQPCQNGATCNGKFDSYTCECAAGFEGTHCECARFKPCGDQGTCIDGKSNYDCNCDESFGGKNCTVTLSGCENAPCLNDGFCKPYLVNETEHLFNCTCQHGFQGDTCEKTTTISMVVSSLITVKTQREEGYDISFLLRTALPNGVLAFGTSGSQNEPVSYILELINGRLNLHSSLLNKWEGVFIGTNLNDSNWHKVFVAINKTHLVLSANDEQAIYPVRSYETANGSQPSFPWTYLGGTIPIIRAYLRHLTHRPSSFVGCMQDIVVNDKWIIPEDTNDDENTELIDVQSGCLHTKQCQPSTCHGGFCNSYISNGTERRFDCTCLNGFKGDTCEKTTMLSMTDSSLITVRTERTYGYAISLQFRTKFPNGSMAFGTAESQNAPLSYILELVNGRLYLHSSLLNKWDGVFMATNLNDSKWHTVFLAINTTHLLLTVDEGNIIFPVASNEIKVSFPLTYLGGNIPQLKSYLGHLTHQPLSFVGCMQDVVVNDKLVFPEENNDDLDTDLKNVQSGCFGAVSPLRF